MGLKYPYIWTFCAFAALGACQYGYDGMRCAPFIRDANV